MSNDWIKEWLKEQVERASYYPSEDDMYEDQETRTLSDIMSSLTVEERLSLDPQGWSFGGKELGEIIQGFNGKIEMAVEGLIARNSLNMWYADDGLGKSTLALQSALEQANGMKVFRHLVCNGRQNVLYVVGERHYNEPFSRIKTMSEFEKFDYENFHITGKFQGYNLASEKNHTTCCDILHDIVNNKFGGRVDIIYFDPLNALVTGDMKEDRVASSIRMFISRVMSQFNCSVVFTHHENRGQRNQKTAKREGQDFYGNKFLSTMSTAIMHLKKNNKGTLWVNEKDSYKCCYSPIPMIFDSETLLSEIDKEHTPITKTTEVHKYINHLFIMGDNFTKADIERHIEHLELNISDFLLNKIIKSLLKDRKIQNIHKKGVNAEYKILGKIDL